MPSQTQPGFDTLGRYSDLVCRGVVFAAYATMTAPVIYSTAAGTGGPLLYNPSTSGKKLHLLAVSCNMSVASIVVSSLGIGTGASTAPSTTTAIDLSANILGPTDGNASVMNVYRLGTVSAACTAYIPIYEFHATLPTTVLPATNWVDVGGLFVATPGRFVTIAAGATLTTLQVQVGAIWAEL